MVTDSIAVIIPYYQRRSGLLSQALASIFAQIAPNVTCIIIVDDGSPHPASVELAGFSVSERSRIMLIEQHNAGVSAARNKALDNLPSHIEIVAFLDSDDRWSVDHIANALAAFDQGATFYFSDFRRDNSQNTRFERSCLRPDPMTRLQAGNNLYRYQGPVIFDMVRSTMVGTSTVVMRRYLIGDRRFWKDVSASEDIYFWASCLFGRENGVYFSINCEAFYNSTDGLISSARWGSRRILEATSDQLRILYQFTEFAIGNSPFQDWIVAERRRLGREFFINLRHRVLRFKPVNLKLVFNFLRFWLTPLPSMIDLPKSRSKST
jgi:succinoglycan biosynthesis protein ExoW